MIIDALTIAGLISAASFALMPLLMGREFIRVETCEETRQDGASAVTQPGRSTSARMPDCVETA